MQRREILLQSLADDKAPHRPGKKTPRVCKDIIAEGAENLGILGQGEGMGQNRRHAFRMARQAPAAKSGPEAEACEAWRFCQAVALTLFALPLRDGL